MSLLSRIKKAMFGEPFTVYTGDFAGLTQRVRIDNNGVLEAETKPGEWRAFHRLTKGERRWVLHTTWHNREVCELLARWNDVMNRIEREPDKEVGLKPAESHIRTALKDLLAASAPMVGDEPATPRDYVELNEARKRAAAALEGQP